jgi:hypothetical protein
MNQTDDQLPVATVATAFVHFDAHTYAVEYTQLQERLRPGARADVGAQLWVIQIYVRG